jgi:histidine triad (HIT) family protein
MSADCIFCKIISHQAPADILYQDDHVTAFKDINPVAPIHLLIVPNHHIPSVNELEPEDETVIGKLFSIGRMLAEQQGISSEGYRLIINTGAHGGQMVFHLHLHLIGGRPMRFPMG